MNIRRKCLQVANIIGNRVNVTPTYHTEGQEEEKHNQIIEVMVSGKALWNFFAFRSLLIHSCENAVKEGKWSEEHLRRFNTAIEHCRTHGACQFVADGFGISLKVPEAENVPFSADDSEE